MHAIVMHAMHTMHAMHAMHAMHTMHAMHAMRVMHVMTLPGYFRLPGYLVACRSPKSWIEFVPEAWLHLPGDRSVTIHCPG